MDKIKASIIIPTKDKLSRLLLVLKVLENQITGDIEVIIIFDGCKPETIHNFEQHKFSFNPIIIICKENIGRAAARNKGIERAANGSIIIFSDDDRIPSEDFIKRHIEGQRKPCVLLGKRYDVSFTESEIEKLFFTERENIYRQVRGNSYTARESSEIYKRLFPLFGFLRWIFFWTGNASIPKKILNEAGNFNENFIGWGYEDTELGYRLYKKDILFKTDFNIINYHLLHETNNKEKYKECDKNIKLMIKTCQGDMMTIFILRCLNLQNWWLHNVKKSRTNKTNDFKVKNGEVGKSLIKENREI